MLKSCRCTTTQRRFFRVYKVMKQKNVMKKYVRPPVKQVNKVIKKKEDIVLAVSL